MIGNELFQLLAANGILQFANRFGFNLPHAFTRDFEDPANLFQRVGIAIAQTIPQPNDLSFAVRQRFQQLVDLVTQNAVGGRSHRIIRLRIFDELTKAAILTVANGPVQ